MKPIIFMTLLAFLISGCSFNKYRNNPFNEYGNYSVTDGIVLAVSQQETDLIRLKIRNDRTTPIFFGYQRGEDTKPSIVRYRLVCYQNFQAVEETDFGPKDHSGMGLNPLESGDELEFEVSPLPKFRRNCYISVGYYNDVKAVEVVKKFDSNPYVDLTEEEKEFIEQSKQKAIVTINLNGK
jgi:hypothetical protein